MITTRTARQCGQADYGWLQARYTFSFGHYFDPKLLGYASLRVLNQEVLAPGAAFQPRTYPKVDILNVILDGEAEYRDSEGNHVQASAGETLLLSTQPGISYSEHNLSKDKPLTRMQLWLDACPQRENPLIQKLALNMGKQQLIASPEAQWVACNCASKCGCTISCSTKAKVRISSCMDHARICNRFTGNFMRLRIMKRKRR